MICDMIPLPKVEQPRDHLIQLRDRYRQDAYLVGTAGEDAAQQALDAVTRLLADHRSAGVR
ncbi:hypothetical protein [Pseudonocardia asaccharolytica]|uniref:Uncharacterized protein n=2 Tax=Pseudonocardia asaccharolytica TaxID=54010 RepID=A0A511D3D1_9PSEU|nr:hypothetical protein [Pseudonocardia asaccharolytica]GEL19296.1 hypothetical protein PA7_31330 [Pseudonocardia asaccharolytica DSM 44247 = NBRC 16224]